MTDADRIAILRSRVFKAAQQFRVYEQHHRAKNTQVSMVKARVNAKLAEDFEHILEETK